MKHFKSLKLMFLAFAGLFVGGLRENFATANAETATGTDKVFTRRADAAFTYTHLLCKSGTDAFHVNVAGASDRPFGSTTDSPFAAEDIVHVDPLNRSDSSRRLRCATALAADIDVYTAANGFVQAEPTVAGTYWLVGRTAALAVQEASSLYTVQVITGPPVKLVVIAALTSSQNATTAATDLTTSEALANALKTSYNALQADHAAFTGALATPALVKVLGS
jgi:hypothetical protein